MSNLILTSVAHVIEEQPNQYLTVHSAVQLQLRNAGLVLRNAKGQCLEICRVIVYGGHFSH